MSVNATADNPNVADTSSEIASIPDGLVSVRVLAACFALSGFAIAAVNGLAHGARSDDVLMHAMQSMFWCFLIGIGVGIAARIAAREHLHDHAQRFPVPESALEHVRSGGEESAETS